MRIPLPDISISRPITVIMVAISLLVLGYISWNRIPLKFLPKVDRPYIGCFIPYLGGSPEQVEQQIAIPVEGEFRTIPGLRSISSTSSPNGCMVNLWFDLNTDMTIATADVRDRIERLKLVLPQEVEKIIIQRFSSESIPVIAIGLFKAEEEEDYVYLVRTSLVPRLKRLEGVADIRLISPIPEKEVLIEVSQDTLNSLNLPIISLLNTLRTSSVSMTAGTITQEEFKYFIKVNSEFKKLSDIENTVVTKEGLRLKDIANIKFGSREDSQRVSLDGKGGVVLLVIKESEANAVEVCNSVKEELNRILTEESFIGTTTKIFFDQSDLINRALKNLFSEGIYGGIMAFTVLLLFLHRLLPTIIVSFAIPSSLMIGVIFMYFSGMSLNIITMVSLIISVGMLVDNAIVVVENVIRYQQLGYDKKTSAIRGSSEVGMAITASTITTVVVFLPMYYLEAGRMSVFMKQLGGPLIVALLGSLVLALTIVPLILSYENIANENTSKKSKLQTKLRTLGNSLSQLFSKYKVVEKMQNILESSLRWSLENRLSFLILISTFLFISYLIPIKSVGMKDLIKLDTREIDIRVSLDQNFDQSKVRDLFDNLAQKIEELREKLGIKNILLFHSKNGGEIHVYLYTEDDGEIGRNPPCTTEEAFETIRNKLPRYIPGGRLEFSIADTGESGTLREISLRLTGPDNSVLFDLSQLVKDLLLGDPLFSDIRVDVEQKKDELRVNINETFANEQGVNPILIAQTIDTALRGAQIPYMKEENREIPVWLQFKEEDRQNKSSLDNLLVFSNKGVLVPLSQVIEYTKRPGPEIIKRYNGRNVINLYAKANTEDLMLIKTKLQQLISKIDLPYGYTLNYGIELEEIQTNLANFMFTMSMAIVLIYIVMAASFESFLLPFIILTVVPLSLVGSAWTLFFLNSHWDMVTLIGCVLMVGVIVNNGIVIVDHINFLKKNNPSKSRIDIIIQASKDRLRPVFMTALTTILGLVPLATAKSGGAVIFSGLGKALVGGLSLGTILTLVVVPVFYTIVDEIENLTVRTITSLRTFRNTNLILAENTESSPRTQLK
ncbi:MAG: efflux RND transporter permease subunit [Candidatus Hydrogenedentes bacterium]|nr:efflux RND transporter permease subunit [Candidatus Hydrogenedentota bacterium]